MSKNIVVKITEQYEQRLKRHRQFFASKLKANDEQHKLRVERRRQYVLKIKKHLECPPHQHKNTHLGGQKYNLKHRANEIDEHKKLVKYQQTKECVDIAGKRPECYNPLKNVQKCANSENFTQGDNSICINHDHAPVNTIKTEPNSQEYDHIYYNMGICRSPTLNVNHVSDAVPKIDLCDRVNSNNLQSKDDVNLGHEYENRKHIKMEINVETEGIQQSTINREKYYRIDKAVKDVQLKYYLKEHNISEATNIETINEHTEKNICIKIEPLDD